MTNVPSEAEAAPLVSSSRFTPQGKVTSPADRACAPSSVCGRDVTHRSDLERIWFFALSEISQLGHPVKLLIQLLQQKGGVEHLLLVGLEQIIVQLGELLGKLEGTVQLLSQLVLGGVTGRTVCPEVKKTKGRHVKGKLKREETRMEISSCSRNLKPGPRLSAGPQIVCHQSVTKLRAHPRMQINTRLPSSRKSCSGKQCHLN